MIVDFILFLLAFCAGIVATLAFLESGNIIAEKGFLLFFRERITEWFRGAVYIIVTFFLVAYVIGVAFQADWFLNFTKFDSSNGIFWILILALSISHLPELRSLVHSIVTDKISNYTDDQLFDKLLARSGGERYLTVIAGAVRKLNEANERKSNPPTPDINL